MSTLDAPLRTALETGLDGTYDVVGYPGGPYSVPTVALWATRIARLTAAPAGAYEVTYTVEIIVSRDAPAKADVLLDAALLDVLGVLWDAGSFQVESAERTVTEDNTNHSWTLTVTGGFTITEA